MPKDLSRVLLRAFVGFVLGLAIWRGLAVPYTSLIGSLSELALAIVEAPAVTQLTPQGTLLIADRSDLPASAEVRFAVESTELTFNVIVLMTLFAAASSPLAERNLLGLLGAAVVLVFVHVAAVMSFVEGHYATSLGDWSSSRYGFLSRHFWSAAPYFYGVIGVHGAPIALWWLFRPAEEQRTKRSSRDAARAPIAAGRREARSPQ